MWVLEKTFLGEKTFGKGMFVSYNKRLLFHKDDAPLQVFGNIPEPSQSKVDAPSIEAVGQVKTSCWKHPEAYERSLLRQTDDTGRDHCCGQIVRSAYAEGAIHLAWNEISRLQSFENPAHTTANFGRDLHCKRSRFHPRGPSYEKVILQSLSQPSKSVTNS